MVTLTIDDKQVTVEKDATIYDAAKAAGINIPILCHDKKLKPFGACRMCLVEVEQMKGRLIPACTTPVTEGMIVRCTTPAVEKARKLVLELLMLNHPLDCPVCDKAGDCELQNLAYDHKVDTNRFSDEKFHHEIDYNNPLIERDTNRCVLCGKCVRICDEIVCRGALTFMNRGIETRIGTEFDGPLDCEFCGSCISVCPVGALLSRPFKFKARFWALAKKKSVCGYCGTGCNITLGVKDNKVLTTVYDENQGFHNGQLCCRGRFGYQFISSDKRIKTPMIRKNGSFVEATWDEALDLVAARLKGGSSVAALATPRLTNEELHLFRRFMVEQVGSKNFDHSAGYGHAALSEGFAASFGVAASTARITDIQKSNYLLVIKTDAYETHPVIGFEMNMAVKNRGVKLRTITDKKGKLSRLPGACTSLVAPGTETAVINALCKEIIDSGKACANAASNPGYAQLVSYLGGYSAEKVSAVSGMAADEIKAVAAEYASAEKAVILFPVGLAYPGHTAGMARALANLALLAGKVGVSEGSGILCMSEKNNSQGAVDMKFAASADGLSGLAIIDAALSGSVKSMFIAGENPVVSYPNAKKVRAALDKLDFLVVSDLFMTETAALADVVLPASSYAEKEGTFTSTDRKVQYLKPAIPKAGSSRTDFEILSALIARMGGTPPASPEAAFCEITAANEAYKGMTYASLGETGAFTDIRIQPAFTLPGDTTVTAEPGKTALLTGSVLYHSGTLSRFGEGPTFVCPEGYIEISRQDSTKSGFKDGDVVSVTSASGSIRLPVRVSMRLPQGVVFAPYHFASNPVNEIWSGEAVTWVSLSK